MVVRATGVLVPVGRVPWPRVHRAAARASLATGMAITTHGVQSAVGLAQLKLFTEEGVDPARAVNRNKIESTKDYFFRLFRK